MLINYSLLFFRYDLIVFSTTILIKIEYYTDGSSKHDTSTVAALVWIERIASLSDVASSFLRMKPMAANQNYFRNIMTTTK